MIYIFDSECFKYDWLFVFKCVADGEYTVIHNDNDALRAFVESNAPMLIGFNNKHYDQFILKGAMSNLTPVEVHDINDWIILQGKEGWDCPLIKNVRTPYFAQADVMDDMQTGLSLKAIEGHLGMNITESQVDFNINRPLTEEELEQTIHYCKCDVDATEVIYKLRKDYFQTKVDIGEMAGISAEKAMYATNAKLTAMLLKAESKAHKDERSYKYPDNLLREYIPDEVFKFFDRIGDESVSDEDLWSSKLEITVGGCPVTLGFGGIHGAIPNYKQGI